VAHDHDSGKVAIIAAFLANLGIAIAKFLGFLVTGAASMLAESIHSVADTGNQGLLMLGRARSRRRPDPQHPFGYGRARYFWAFIVAVVLFLLGGLFAIFEGIEKLRNPHEVESLGWAVGILAFAMVLEGLSFRTAVREARPAKGDESWWSFIRHAKGPELPVVLLEDFGALIGLSFAMTGVVLAAVTDHPSFDAAGSLAIGILLVVIAATLAWEMSSLLVGEAASPDDVEKIRRAMEEGPDVKRLIHMRTEHLGPDELLIAAKVEFRRGITVVELAHAIDTAEARVRAVIDERAWIYLEPDLFDAARAPQEPTEPNVRPAS
jgi:cation diffusion facilitator family transporter